jgi:hypothetical protein
MRRTSEGVRGIRLDRFLGTSPTQIYLAPQAGQEWGA